MSGISREFQKVFLRWAKPRMKNVVGKGTGEVILNAFTTLLRDFEHRITRLQKVAIDHYYRPGGPAVVATAQLPHWQ